MSAIKFLCPSCNQHIACGPEYAGLTVNCPSCQTAMIVPGGPEAPPPDITGSTCPGCKVSLPQGAVICTSCGMDLRTGKRMQLQSGSTARSQRLSRGPASEPKRTLLIAGIAGLIVFSMVGFGNPLLSMTTLIGLWIFGAIVGIWALVSAFQDTLIQGLLVMFVPCYVLFFIFFRSDSPALRRWASIHLISIFALVAGIGLRIVQAGNVSSIN